MSLSKYPNRLDMFQTKKNAKFDGDPNGDFVMADDVNQLQDAISAIEESLGINPQGNKTSVSERISLLEGSSSLRVPSFLIYLGSPSKINESETLLEAMGHFAKYDHVVLGNNANDPSDPDWQATKEIIDGVRSSKSVKFYGYIDAGVNTLNLSVSELQIMIQQWKDIEAEGIYCANFGFENRVSRDRQNEILDSIHQHDMVAILDAENPEEVFTDLFHETMNPNWLEPRTEEGDVYHYSSYCLDTSRTPVFEPNVMGGINKLIALYDYRVNKGIRIFGTPVIQTNIDKETAQDYYDYAHASALVTSMDAFHPTIEGYGAATNSAPTYDWVPIAGSWYMASPRVEYDDQGILCVRETPFGRIILNTKEHTYSYEGIYIPFSMLKIAANSIEGTYLKDSSIEDKKIKTYKGSRLIDAINAETDTEKLINIAKVMKLDYSNIGGNIPADVLRANVIEAINANIGFAKIGSAVIGDLTAGHIKAGTIDAERISASVVHALNLYAENMEVGSAKIGEAVIGNLSAEKITAGSIDAERIKAGVIEAINLSADQANIKNLNADNITAGNIKAERIQAEVINAMNLYAENMVAGSAKIDTAIIGDLKANHIQSAVISAIEANIGKATIDSAIIGELTAEHMQAEVVNAIKLYAGEAKIDQAVIGDLSATKITAGDIDADRIKGQVIEAINLNAELATIDAAVIGDLTAGHIKSGDIDAERIAAGVVSAVDIYSKTMTAESATFNNAVIGSLDVSNMRAAVISAVNATLETAKIESAAIGSLEAGNIKAAVIEAINLNAEIATIDEAVIGDLNAKKITAGDIDAERLAANVVNAINITAEHMKIDAGHIGQLTSEHIKAGVIEALEANIGTATIDSALIGDLTADHIKAVVLEAIDLSAETATIDSAKIGALTAEHIQAEVLRAIELSTEKAVIDSAKIGDLTADHIKGVVIKAIDLSAETATIDAAKIRDITAEMVSTGHLDANVMWANLIEAINMDVQTATIGAARIGALTADHIKASVIDAIEANIGTATIDAAIIGELSAEHIQASVMEALEANIGTAKIDQALIGSLQASHIQGVVLEAIELSAESAVIDQAKIGDLDAKKITAGDISADRMKVNAISAVNGNFNNATIESAKIGVLQADKMSANIIAALEANIGTAYIDQGLIKNLSAEKIDAGDIHVDRLRAHTVEAINANLSTAKIDAAQIGSLKAANIKAEVIEAINASIEEATIDAAQIGSLTADHIKAEIIEAINASIENVKIDAAQIGKLQVDNLNAAVINAINASIETAKIKSAFIGELEADKMTANVIAALEANIGKATIDEALIGTVNANKINGGEINADVLTANVVKAINSVTQTAVIESAKIGSLSADKIQASVIDAINANIEGTAKINKAIIPTLDAGHIKTSVIEAVNANIEGTAKINGAVIGSLKAGHIQAEVIQAINANIGGTAKINKAIIPTLDAGHIQATVIDAINATVTGRAVINEAQIGNLNAGKLTAGNINADRMKVNVISAVNGNLNNATIEAAKIGSLDVGNIRANVIEAINARLDSVTINAARIGSLKAANIKAEVIEAINASIETAQIKSAKIGVLEADKMSANIINALEANVGKAYINEGLINTLNAGKINAGDIAVERMKANAIAAVNADITDATIDAAQIGSLKAGNIKAEIIEAINASIEEATIDAAQIGQLKADNIKTHVLEAINASIETVKIKEGQIGDLTAEKITAGNINADRLRANVVAAINSEFQYAQIKEAKIGDLSAEKIKTGSIDAERMTANIVNAINTYTANMVAGSAKIDSGVMGTLAVSHMQAQVINAVNASLGSVKINNAKIDALTAGHIQAAVIEAINANIDKAQIKEGLIADLTAEKIKTGSLSAEVMKANAIHAINADITDAKIDAAQIKALTADHIKANVLEAINASVETAKIKAAQIGELDVANIRAAAIAAVNASIGEATIDAAKIGSLKAANIQAEVIQAINADIDKAKIGAAKIDTLTADHIKAVVVDAINGRFGSATIDAAKIGVLESANIKAGSITSNHISTIGLNANVIKTGFLDSERIIAGSITGTHINSNTIETKHLRAGQIDGSVLKGDTIHGSKIIAGTLSASNLTAGSITSVEIAAKTIQTRNLAAGAVDASVLRAGTITAEHISTIGLDANLIEVFGNDGQVLIGDGYVKVDGLDMGVVQSDNLVGNGLFLTASSAFGNLRDNPIGEAILGNQSKIEGAHQVWRIDTTTGERLAIDTGGTKPADIVIDSTYEYIYVTLQGDDKLAQIQVSQGTQATRTGATLSMGKGPGKALYTGDKLMDHKHFFVLNTDPKDVNIPDSLSIIDAPPTSISEDLYVHHMIALGNTPYDLAVQMIMEATDLVPGAENPHPGHKMYTYITQAGQGDIAVLDMSHPNSTHWKVVRTIPIGAHMTDNYHGGLEGRFGLGVAVGGDSSSQYSDADAASMAGHNHGHGGYATSDGSIREYTPHGISLSADPNLLYVTDYANGHLLVVDINGKAPYNPLTGSRVTGNLGNRPLGPGQIGESGGGTGTPLPPTDGDGDHDHHMHSMSMAAEEDMFSIQAGGHGGHGMDDSEPVKVPGMTGVITQEMQTTRWVRYRIPVGDSPERIEVIGGKIFITLEGSNAIAVLDEADILAEVSADYEYYGPRWNEFTDFRALPTFDVRRIEVGAKPSEMTVSPNEQELFVTVNGQNQIVRVNIATEQITYRYQTGPNPKGLKVSPDGKHIYVVNHGGSGNLSFVYPTGNYIGDAYLGLEGGIEYQGAEHWIPNRSDWVYDAENSMKVQSASMIEFHINEPFLNEGGFARIATHGIDPQVATIEQDIYNVSNLSNGNNIATADAEQLKQDASLLRFWPKEEWLKEHNVRNVTIFAKTDESLRRDAVDNRVFYPTKNWIDTPERPVILVGMSGDFVEVSENNYTITYGAGAKIVFDEAVAGDKEVYSSAYYYSEKADPTKFTVYYEGDVETSGTGTVYGDSHITFADKYLPQGAIIKVDYTFRHNRWFRSHNGSVLIAMENSSSENFYVQFEVDEFVPKFITYDNQQTEDFKYWPIEVPSVTRADYTGIQYSGETNRAIGAAVTASATPTATSGPLSAITDNLEPMDDGEEHSGHMHMMHAYGETVELPTGKQHVIVDLGKTYMVTDVHITHAFHKNRQYHGTKTEVSQDGVHWTTIYDSAVQGEYVESEYMESHGMTHYGKHHKLGPQLPVRYVRDWANGYTEWATTSTDVSTWNKTTLVGKFPTNHWTEIKVFGDWEFEKEFSRNYTAELLNTDPRLEKVAFKKGKVTVTGGNKTTNIGGDDTQDVTRIVDKDLLAQRYFTKGNGAATVTVDLGAIQKVDTLRIYRYYADYRIHGGVKTEYSKDGVTWTTVYTTAANGEYEERPGGKIISLGGVKDVRYIRDTATSWKATLKTGTVLTGNDIRWMGIHAYLGYDASYPYLYQPGSELEGQNLATNGQGIVTTEVSRAFAAIDLPIDFTSWWYMTYIVGPEFGQVDVEMPTVMGGSHSLFEDAPYLNKVAHRHIMSWPSSENVKEDTSQGIKAGMHRAIVRQKSGKASIDRFRFEDYQYLYMNSTEIPRGNATNFMRYKIEPEVAKWYVGRGNQSTQGAYDHMNVNNDTGKPDGSVAIKYRFRVKARLNPKGIREERGVAYVTSAIFETGRLSSHWRMSQTQDSYPGNRIQRWDPNQPHKTGIQHDHLANGAIRGSKLMPHAVMDHHISPYAKIEESKLNLKYSTHRHGEFKNQTMPDGSQVSSWFDNKDIIDSIEGFGTSGHSNKVARADHSHSMFMNDIMVHGNVEAMHAMSADGHHEWATFNGIELVGFKKAFDAHVAAADVHFTVDERTKLAGIVEGANKVLNSSTNGNILVDGVQAIVYTHPTTAGNKHIPTGGASGNFLKYSASGTAAWANVAWADVTGKPATFTPPNATASVLGGVRVGSGLDVEADGTISWSHPTGDGQQHVPATGTGNANKVLKAGTTIASASWGQVQFGELGGSLSAMQHGQLGGGGLHSNATAAMDGFQSKEDKAKLDGIAANANNYSHPATHSLDMITETTDKKVLTAAERTKLAGIATGANNYVHPATHTLDVITETATKKVMTSAERTKLEGIQANAINQETADARYLQQSGGGIADGLSITGVGDATLTLNADTDNDSLEVGEPKVVFKQDAGLVGAEIKVSQSGANANTLVLAPFMDYNTVTPIANYNVFIHDKKIWHEGTLSKSEFATAGHVHPNASNAVHGFMSKEDFYKLSTIAPDANNYVHPATHSLDMIVETATQKILTAAERTKLSGIATNANNYVHPATHPASVIVEAVDKRFMLDAERTKLSAIEANANLYVHPATHSADMITDSATKVVMTSSERTKLAGIATSANNYVHPATHALDMVTETATLKVMTAAERTKLAGIATNANNYAHPAGDGNLHVPATGTVNNAKVLKAGATAGSVAWGQVEWSEITGKPTAFTPVIASASALGGIMVGENLVIDAAGRLSAQNSYVHPAGDGNKHVPADGGTNSNKVLKATSTSGSPVWGSVAYTELTGVPSTFNPSTHNHALGDVTGLDAALSARAVLASNNTFTKINTFTNPGLSVKIQPSSVVAANTVLFQVNNSLGGSLVTMGASEDGQAVARVVINGNLEVTGTTVQKSTQDIQGDMNVTGNLNVTGDAVLGDNLSDLTRVSGDLVVNGNTTLGSSDKGVTAKGDLRIEGNFVPVGKYLEVGRFPIYGIAGDPQFQTEDAGVFEEIVDHIATFNTAGLSCLAPPAAGATRFYKLMLSYSSTGTADSVVRIVQSNGTTEVFSSVLPAVNGTVLNRARTWMSAPFSTLHGGDTIFQAKKNTGGALAIRYVEVIALDYFN